MNVFNTAVLLLPDIPLFEGCRRAALDRAVTVSNLHSRTPIHTTLNLILIFQAQSDYRTLPIIGYDPNDHHHWFTMGRKHNAFNPESQSDNIDTKYAIDRMRITQVKTSKSEL